MGVFVCLRRVLSFWLERNCSFHVFLMLRLKRVNKDRVQWEPLFSQALLSMELLTLVRKFLLNSGERKKSEVVNGEK